MENFVIFGDSPFAERMFSYIKIEGIAKVKAFTQEKNYIHREYIDGIKVIPFDELEPSEDFSVLLGIGYSKMNTLRESIYRLLKKRNFNIGKYISRNANIYIKPGKIGEGSFLCPNICIGPNCSIGVCNIFESGTNLAHDNDVGNYNYFSVGSIVAGNTKIENNCFLGSNCTVIDDVIVKNQTLLGSGANVVDFDYTYDGGGVCGKSSENGRWKKINGNKNLENRYYSVRLMPIPANKELCVK